MELQAIFDIVLGLAAVLCGLLLRYYNQQLRDGKREITVLQTQLNDWQLKVAEEYVRRGEFIASKGETLEHLRRIEDKLDRLIERG